MCKNCCCRKWKEKNKKDEIPDATVVLVDKQVKDLDSFVIKTKDIDVSVYVEDSVYKRATDADFPMDQIVAGKLALGLAKVSFLRKLEVTVTDPAEFGFDEPVGTFSAVYDDKSTIALTVGDYNRHAGGHYCMTADGTVPQFGQLPQPSMQPLSDHWRLLCGRMSAATGIHVSQFGQVHDNPASSDAIYAENEPLILKVKDWNEDAGECLSDVAVACLATEWGKTFDEVMDMGLDVGASFANPAMPTLAQQTDASVKMASVLDGFAETDTFLALNGFGEEERKRIRRELDDVRRAANRDAMIASVFGGTADEGASDDETSA